MDIYAFIRSPDIGDYCRSIGHIFSPLEMAVIVAQSNMTLAEKHDAWWHIISDCQDMSIPEMHCFNARDSLHECLRELIANNNYDIDPNDDISTIFIHVPVPFQKGDILECKGTVHVLYDLPHWFVDDGTGASYEKMRTGEFFDDTDMVAYTYRILENGSVFHGHGPSYLELKFYRGEPNMVDPRLLELSASIKRTP